MVSNKVIQKINLIDGKFTPSEASDIIEALIREKIDFHKIQRLQSWVGDCNSDSRQLNGRIGELVNERKIAKDFFAEARKAGANLVIKGTLEISFTD